MEKPIGLGIIGANPSAGWASTAHIPALNKLPGFRIAAVSTSREESARQAGKAFGIEAAYAHHQQLVTHPDVDVVVVTVKVPYHFELVSAALEAGKSVYCEWPLGNGLKETEQLARLAKEKNVLGVVGLQSRSAPLVNYVKDLVNQGYIGEVLSTSLIGSGMVWGDAMDQSRTYLADLKNGATMLTIPFGHTVDALCYCLGEFSEVSANLHNRRKEFTVVETGEQLPMTSHDQVTVMGKLQSGATASIHYRGGMFRGTNLLWEINGTRGDLQITGNLGHLQMAELKLYGATGDEPALKEMTIPDEYISPQLQPELGFGFNVGHAYASFEKDYREGSHLCPTFEDAVIRHRMIDTIETAARTGLRQVL